MDQSQKNEAVAQFLSVTGASPSEAQTFLANCDWDVSNAVSTYFAAQDGGADSDVDVDAPAAAEAEYTGPRTLDGRPAPESETRASAPASSSRRQPPRGGIATLGSIGQQDAHAGHGHDDDSDDGSDDEQPRDLYAGGEKSGQFVQDPNNRGNDARKLVNDIMKKAKEQTKAQREAILENKAPAKPSRFTGSGVTLGGDDAPSTAVPDTAAAAPVTPASVRRVLHLWNDGFSVEDGPLRRFDDPNNASDLAMINQGRAPAHLMNVSYGQSVDVQLIRHESDYVKPKTVWKPFGGSGQRLGSPVPGDDTAPAQSAPAPAAASSSSGSAAPEVNIDSSQPTLNLRIQLADGTRLPARFNTTHTVGDIYDFINRASPDSGARSWVLSTTFPNKNHTDKSQVLGDMPEFKRGGTAVQKWV